MRHYRSQTRGYALRDLFIVIFVISVLLALLLPAIQAARESARRTQCTNNLKNIVLGLQNYHDTYRMFPMGAMHAGVHPQGEPPNDARLGPSWWYGILPFVIQSGIYDGIQRSQKESGAAQYGFCADDMVTAGVRWTDNAGGIHRWTGRWQPDFMRCPSSPLPSSENKSGPICLPSYVGITGGCDIDPASQDYETVPSTLRGRAMQVYHNVDPAPQDDETTPWTATIRIYHNLAKGTGASPGGIVTSSGMLPPCEHVPMADCTDGTSNTIIVGEQSDWLCDNANGKYHGDAGWTVGGTGAGGGWLSGTRRCDPVPPRDAAGGPPARWDADCWNLTTVRYPPNTKYVMGAQPLPGCSENHGINNPLQSPHPRGMLVAFVDGSVQFFATKTDLAILLRCAIRNDGQNVIFE